MHQKSSLKTKLGSQLTSFLSVFGSFAAPLPGPENQAETNIYPEYPKASEGGTTYDITFPKLEDVDANDFFLNEDAIYHYLSGKYEWLFTSNKKTFQREYINEHPKILYRFERQAHVGDCA